MFLCFDFSDVQPSLFIPIEEELGFYGGDLLHGLFRSRCSLFWSCSPRDSEAVKVFHGALLSVLRSVHHLLIASTISSLPLPIQADLALLFLDYNGFQVLRVLGLQLVRYCLWFMLESNTIWGAAIQI